MNKEINYVPFDYGKDVNAWRADWRTLPSSLRKRESREKAYYKLVDLLSDDMSKDDAFLAKYDTKQEQWPAKRILEYILELLPPQDLFDFARHEPMPPYKIFMRAAEIYDKPCFNEAISLLQQPSIPTCSMSQC